MIPLLFPHTYISPRAAEAAAHFFSQLRVYQPVEDCLPDDLIPWIDSGFLNMHQPVSDADDKVAAAVKDFQQWARQHRHGRDLKNILPRMGNSRPPFFDDHATAQILTDLKSPRKKQSDPARQLFNARLFLCLAQDFDQRRRELSDQLDRVAAESQAMVDQLQHSAARQMLDPTDHATVLSADTPEFMPSERLNAWARLFLADTLQRSMLLTTSPAVIADLISANDQASVLMVLNKGDYPSPGEAAAADSVASLAAKIEDARHQSPPVEPRRAPLPDDEVADADLTLYLFANRSLRSVIAKAAGLQTAGRIQPHPDGTTVEHAVVGLLRAERP